MNDFVILCGENITDENTKETQEKGKNLSAKNDAILVVRITITYTAFIPDIAH